MRTIDPTMIALKKQIKAAENDAKHVQIMADSNAMRTCDRCKNRMFRTFFKPGSDTCDYCCFKSNTKRKETRKANLRRKELFLKEVLQGKV